MKNFKIYLLGVFLLFSFKTEAQDKGSTDFYVIATSGLNYRAKPKGELLGKFTLNTKVKIIERTGIYQEIKDEGQTKDGEWVGVQKEESVVYVFDAFLNKEKYETPLIFMKFKIIIENQHILVL